MKKIILAAVATALLVGAVSAGCTGTYARLVGEIKVDYKTKECVYETGNKRHSMIWSANDRCPQSIQVDYRGTICKVN